MRASFIFRFSALVLFCLVIATCTNQEPEPFFLSENRSCAITGIERRVNNNYHSSFQILYQDLETERLDSIIWTIDTGPGNQPNVNILKPTYSHKGLERLEYLVWNPYVSGWQFFYKDGRVQYSSTISPVEVHDRYDRDAYGRVVSNEGGQFRAKGRWDATWVRALEYDDEWALTDMTEHYFAGAQISWQIDNTSMDNVLRDHQLLLLLSSADRFYRLIYMSEKLPSMIVREAPEEFDDNVTISLSYELNNQGFPVKISRLVEHEVYEAIVWEDSFEYICN